MYTAGYVISSLSSSADIVTIKYNSLGVLQWARKEGGASPEQANDITVSDSGYVYVTGETGSDVVTIKYDVAGTQVWRKDYNDGPGSTEIGQCVILDDSNNVYIGGSVGDYLLIKYNAGGEQKWVQKYNGPDNYKDYFAGMTMDGNGNTYLTGEIEDTSETDGFYYPHCGTVKINNAGAIEWSRLGPLRTNGFDIEVDNAGGIYVVGWGRGDNSQDLLAIKYSPSVGVQTISNEIPGKFSLMQNYPNPFNPVTRIKFGLPSNGGIIKSPVKLAIYNSLGKEIAVVVNENLAPGSYEYSWDASAYASGIYFYGLTGGGYSETKKMILIK